MSSSLLVILPVVCLWEIELIHSPVSLGLHQLQVSQVVIIMTKLNKTVFVLHKRIFKPSRCGAACRGSLL